MRRTARLAAVLTACGVLAGCGGTALPGARTPLPSPSSALPADTPARPAPDAPPATRPVVPEVSVPSLSVPSLSVPPRFTGPVLGGDVSWPQCPKGMGIPEKQGLGLPMPLPQARFVVLGLTNGPGFTPNPCLADQVRWVRERNLMASAYSVLSYPDEATLARHRADGPFDGTGLAGALANVGYQQARFNVATMRAAGLTTPAVWLDVEPVPAFAWSDDPAANAAVVTGAARGYRDAGYQLGVYSTQALWAEVVGDLRLGLPEWRAAGQTSRAEALRRCGPDRMFQGGAPVLAQWVEADRDLNVTCPGAEDELYRWFHQY